MTVPHSFTLNTEKRSRANSRSNNLSPSTVSSSARKPLHMQRRVPSRMHIKMFSPRVSADRNSELLTAAEVLRRISSADGFTEREAQRSIAEDVRAKMPPAPRGKKAMQPAGSLQRSMVQLPSPHSLHSRNNTFMLNKSRAALLENSTFDADEPCTANRVESRPIFLGRQPKSIQKCLSGDSLMEEFEIPYLGA